MDAFENTTVVSYGDILSNNFSMKSVFPEI